MSGLVVFVLALAALAVLALALLVLLARRPAWSRLILVALLTRVFDRPESRRSLRARS